MPKREEEEKSYTPGELKGNKLESKLCNVGLRHTDEDVCSYQRFLN